MSNATKGRTSIDRLALLGTMIIFGVLGATMLAACERAPEAEEAQATEVETSAGEQGQDDSDDHDEDHAHDEVHLGAHMFEIGRRYATVWYAGEAGNKAMVDYQIHEIEEVVDELREAKPMEEGVDVVAYFDRGILPGLEKVEAAVEADDTTTFVAEYDAIIAQCNACHTATKHGFIEVGRPTFNPYANLKMEGE